MSYAKSPTNLRWHVVNPASGRTICRHPITPDWEHADELPEGLHEIREKCSQCFDPYVRSRHMTPVMMQDREVRTK